MEKVFTEEEAIWDTVFKGGYNGNEFKTKAWKERGCLKLDRTQKGLISKLETMYMEVYVSGKGKNRKYHLIEEREHVIERKFNYKGKQFKEDDKIVKEYIHFCLTLLKSNNELDRSYSYKQWSEKFGLPLAKHFSLLKLAKQLKEIHFINVQRFGIIYNSREIAGNFLKEIDGRSVTMIKNSFNLLKKEGKIKLSERYNIKLLDGEYEEISFKKYYTIQEDIEELLNSNGFNYKTYIMAISNPYQTTYSRKMVQLVEDYMKDEHRAEFCFKTFKIELLEGATSVDVGYKEAIHSYFNRIIALVEQRQNRDKYKLSEEVKDRFLLYNTLQLLREIGHSHDLMIHELESKLEEEMVEMKKQIDQRRADSIVWGFNVEIDK